MRMQPVDTLGTLYSAGGLRFGGFQTHQFIELTEELEELRPGVREEIVAEAHYLAYWLHCFPEISFFVGTSISQSLFIGCLAFIGGYMLEMARFYIFGPSPSISNLCRLWNWIKIPLFIGGAILLWPEGKLLSIIIVAFLVFQGWFNIISSIFMLPIRLPICTWIYRRFGERYPHIHNMEGMSMQMVIDRWHRKLSGTLK